MEGDSFGFGPAHPVSRLQPGRSNPHFYTDAIATYGHGYGRAHAGANPHFYPFPRTHFHPNANTRPLNARPDF
ncbi:MAG: hypothetical protein D8M54_07135 [Chloroflexi bacterium]|nr:hypothetical protein [Chloroflexota bacterium]